MNMLVFNPIIEDIGKLFLIIDISMFLAQAPRRVFQALDDSRDTLFDHDENKYKRRSATDLFKRWWK